MVARHSEKGKCMLCTVTKRCVQIAATAFQRRYRINDTKTKQEEEIRKMKGRIDRVDRNKRNNITRDKAQRSVLEKSCSERNKKRQAPKITAGKEKNDSCTRGWKTCVSCRSRRRLSWLLSRERNCSCLSNPTDRNSISSCVSHLPRCVLSLSTTGDIAFSRSLSFSVLLGHPP